MKCSTFDPPGISGHERSRVPVYCSFAACVTIPRSGKVAQRIITDCWEELSKLKWQAIATRLEVTVDEVKAAVEFIRATDSVSRVALSSPLGRSCALARRQGRARRGHPRDPNRA